MFEPTIVYKCPGPYQRPGGTYNYLGIRSQAELDQAYADGWHTTMPEAVESYESRPTLSGAPTREELEIKATELSIKFDGRTSDSKLLSKINEALS